MLEVARRRRGDVALGGDDALEAAGPLLKCDLGLLGLGDVLDHGDGHLRRVVHAGVAPDAHAAPDDLAVLAEVALLVLVGGALVIEQLAVEALGDVDVVRMGELREAHAGELARVVAEHPLDRRIGLDRPAVGSDRDDAHRGAVEQHAEALPALRRGGASGRGVGGPGSAASPSRGTTTVARARGSSA